MDKPQSAQDFIAQQRQAIAGNPDCGTSHYNLAVALTGVQEYEEAEKELMAAIECSPGLAEGYVQLGALCLRRGDLDGCLKWNQQAVKARPGFSEGHGNIGFVHLQKGNVEEAIVSLKRATHFNFRYVQAFASLATAYLMKGEVEESIAASQQAIKIDPQFPIAHNNLGIAYIEKGDFAKAIEHIDRARALGYAVAPQILDELQPHRGD
jgi:tetratricopeptide (TPR) repeat protein